MFKLKPNAKKAHMTTWTSSSFYISIPFPLFSCYFPNSLLPFLIFLPLSLLCLNRKKVLQAGKPQWCPWSSQCLCQCTEVKQILRVAGLRGGPVRASGLLHHPIANLLSLWLVGDRWEAPWLRVLLRLVPRGREIWIVFLSVTLKGLFFLFCIPWWNIYRCCVCRCLFRLRPHCITTLIPPFKMQVWAVLLAKTMSSHPVTQTTSKFNFSWVASDLAVVKHWDFESFRHLLRSNRDVQLKLGPTHNLWPELDDVTH